jgi:hypothetical protein
VAYTSILTEEFRREAKNLSKRYVSFKDDFIEIAESLLINPLQGESLGNNLRKIRLRIKSKNKGKSGGARLIILVLQIEKELVFITIYDKSDLSSMETEALKKLAKQYLDNR